MKGNFIYNHNSIFQVRQQHLFWEEKIKKKEKTHNLAQVGMCRLHFLPATGTHTHPYNS